jgi:hypothetical protein
VIDDIRRRERDGVIELRRLRVGARVRILCGPFRDHLGLCTGMTERERVLILLNVLGAQRQVRCGRAGLAEGLLSWSLTNTPSGAACVSNSGRWGWILLLTSSTLCLRE